MSNLMKKIDERYCELLNDSEVEFCDYYTIV